MSTDAEMSKRGQAKDFNEYRKSLEKVMEIVQQRRELFNRMPEPQTLEEAEELEEVLKKEVQWLETNRNFLVQDFSEIKEELERRGEIVED